MNKLRYARLINELPNEGRKIVNGFRDDNINYPEAKDALGALELNGVLTSAMHKKSMKLLEILLDHKASS